MPKTWLSSSMPTACEAEIMGNPRSEPWITVRRAGCLSKSISHGSYVNMAGMSLVLTAIGLERESPQEKIKKLSVLRP